MREILFRGKTYNDKWVQGLLVQMDDRLTQIRKLGSDGIGYYDYSIVPSTVGQYTGLTDKNGKKIFEGDILEGIRYGNEERAEVLWIDKAASWGIRYSFREKNESGYTSWLNSAWFRSINDARAPVVIGNIHDNPELLEVKE